MRTAVSLIAALSLCGCATLNDSMELGSGIGTLTGLAATFAGYEAAGHSPSFENVAIGAGIGAGIGVLASYFTHKSVESTRATCEADQTEMLFGDLPPSPFILPKTLPKKGKGSL